MKASTRGLPSLAEQPCVVVLVNRPEVACPRFQVKLPLEVGTRVDCKWRDGEYHPARVIERRPVKGTDQHEYYVHYSKCAPPALPPLTNLTNLPCLYVLMGHAYRVPGPASLLVWRKKESPSSETALSRVLQSTGEWTSG